MGSSGVRRREAASGGDGEAYCVWRLAHGRKGAVVWPVRWPSIGDLTSRQACTPTVLSPYKEGWMPSDGAECGYGSRVSGVVMIVQCGVMG